MLDLAKVKTLYDEAVFQAKHTPEIGFTIAANCTTIHFGMRARARELFDRSVQLTIGSIAINGEDHFQFTSQELQSWLAGTVKPRYNLHAWLSLPNHDKEIIDLTLSATLNLSARWKLPNGTTFLTSDEAKANGIAHKAVISGDDILFKLHLMRQY